MYVCWSTQKGAFLHTYRRNIRPPSTLSHTDRRPTYIGVPPGSPKGTVNDTAISTPVPAAFNMILSTLAWVDQSTVSRRVSSNRHQGIPSISVTASHVTQGRVEYRSMIPRSMDEGLDLGESGGEYCILLCGSSNVRILLLQNISIYMPTQITITQKVYFVTVGTSRLGASGDVPAIHAPVPQY